MVINEEIVTGRAHRILIDRAAKLWRRLSYWTKASDVEFNDGKARKQNLALLTESRIPWPLQAPEWHFPQLPETICSNKSIRSTPALAV